MRGLPEIFNIIDGLREVLDEPVKQAPTSPLCPILFYEEHPFTLRNYPRPIIRTAQQYLPLKSATRNKLFTKAKKQEENGKDKDFTVAIDVSSFKPEEISVKVIDRDIIIEAKHDEREDEHGFVSRQFTRKFILPDEYDPDTVSTYINSDGKLTLKALKPKIEVKERIIPIKRVSESDGQEDETANAKKKKDSQESAVDEAQKED